MIAADQPTIFGNEVVVALSSRQDGNMKVGIGSPEDVIQNRKKFLQEAGIDIVHTTLVRITYDTDNFAKYRIVLHADKYAGMEPEKEVEVADALVVDQPNHALFLPLADCVGVVLYDTRRHVLMVSHVGRHSAEVEGAKKSIEYLIKHFQTQPSDVKIWLSPAVGKATYPLHAFDGQSLHEVIIRQLLDAGVNATSIQASSIDTATSENYYSHSEFLKGNDEPGRFAIVAMMTVQGEPAF